MMRVPAVHCAQRALLIVLAALLAACSTSTGDPTYWPGRNTDWERRTPEELGLDSERIAQAIEAAMAAESRAPRDLAVNHLTTFGREPHGEAIGPFTVRGPQTGVIVYQGYIIAEWGEPGRIDNTFSVAKSFLSTTVGLAYDRGLIDDVHDLVRPYIAPIVLEDGDGEPKDLSGRRPKLLFESEHNRQITWDHLLRQTSDWEGTLWGKPEWADRPSRDTATWETRARVGPGTVYEYNDVRVNLLALAAMSVWRRPLPEVLREYVMDPIGASPTWRWYGYDNSWITLDGQQLQAVSGGSHWGGGMLINAYDMARFGLLTLRGGVWDGQQIVSQEWLAMATTPTEVQRGYGFMNFFLNTDAQRVPSAPESTWTHSGAGPNDIYVDPVHDLIIVSRWGNGVSRLVEAVLGAM